MAFSLNEHLNPFLIDTDVDSGIVTLSGMVESENERDLAGEIAAGIDRVVEIDIELTTGMKRKEATATSDIAGRNSPSWFDTEARTAGLRSFPMMAVVPCGGQIQSQEGA